MSSMMSYHANKLVFIAGCVCAASVAVSAALPVSAPLAPQTQEPAPAPRPVLSAEQSQTASAIAQWNVLRRSGDQPFLIYANFLTANRGWPGELALRRNAERALEINAQTPETVIAYFRKLAPLSATSWFHFADALKSSGQGDEASIAARKAWTTGALSFDNESRLLSKFGGSLRADDHDQRMDMLLWSRSTASATRQLSLVSAENHPLFSARLALLSQAGDSPAEIASVGESPKSDPGFLFDYIFWLRKTGQNDVASTLLAESKPKSDVPWSPESWLELRLSFARAASSKSDWRTAYEIARQADDAYAPGTLVRDRSFGERDA